MSNSQHTPIRYEIRVERELGPDLAALFPEFTLIDDNGTTIMRGSLPDQAALHGVLTRLRDLGLTLIAIVRKTTGGPEG